VLKLTNERPFADPDKAARRLIAMPLEAQEALRQSPAREQAMTEFYIYENWVKKAKSVHLADCSYCNHGKGQHLNLSGLNGKWRGPMSKDEVHIFQNLKACKNCKPLEVRA